MCPLVVLLYFHAVMMLCRVSPLATVNPKLIGQSGRHVGYKWELHFTVMLVMQNIMDKGQHTHTEPLVYFYLQKVHGT